jgi:hypothetical protein
MHKKAKLKTASKFLIGSFILLIILLAITIFFYQHKIAKNSADSITYKIQNSLDYNVCLKNNSYYDTQCLDKNNSYVADLIDYINLQFKYNFNASQTLKENYHYNVTAQVIATSKEDNTKVIYNKTTNLIEDTKIANTDGNQMSIDQPIKINYGDYSTIITNFKKDYVLALDAKLIVSMNIAYDGYYNETFNHILDNKVISIEIPLSEQTVAMKTNIGPEINQTIYQNNSEMANNNKKIFASLIMIDTVDLLFIVYIFSVLIPRKKKYDREIEKILKDYDRAIVTTIDKPDLEGYHVYQVSTFDELLDARDNLERPILMYQYQNKDKTLFTIIKENEAYIYNIDGGK